ncbi:E3 ubiquitin-protein ligase RNF186 [Dryobates pubescens]|uniref:E3 ubiquitin-protein ligase RNF186 n=1 Tax=Dryobates pubescens TaxID=118200 RepID=UPI0023B8FBA5|nr:E3 ubiquitin-protein ligase RNF186 [Dryobates pubescens]
MERSTEKPNNAPGLPQAGQDGPVPAEGSSGGPLRATAAGGNRLELTGEGTKETESPAGTEQGGPDTFAAAPAEGECPNSKPLLTGSKPPAVCSFATSPPSSPPAHTDMDCLICFNKYNIYRVPKLLECQHSFCAVCLKLILRREQGAWLITCPLCRKATAVAGGLIRTLQDKEDIMEHLESPDSNLEVHISALGLDNTSWTLSSQDTLYREDTAPADNRLAVQRLVLLLLLLVILTILILPFMYSGLIKWVICLMLTLGLLMSMVLCCTPKLYWRCNRDSLTSCHKETHIAAIA